MFFPRLRFGTPRKLPSVADLDGRVVVLDVAFAANAGGASFEKVTLPFITKLGDRLAMWVDHHDHDLQDEYNQDPRFFLRKKSDHGACPEMITPEMVSNVGKIDTIVCHGDFDGICAAAKWINGGHEVYPGADADAHAVDTRIGTPSELGDTLDKALRARWRDDIQKGLMVHYLATGANDDGLFQEFKKNAEHFNTMERNARALSEGYQVDGDIAICDIRHNTKPYDKTELLLIGQRVAKMALVYDESTITVAAPFDSGIDLVKALGLNGGMPTRVSVGTKKLNKVLEALKTL